MEHLRFIPVSGDQLKKRTKYLIIGPQMYLYSTMCRGVYKGYNGHIMLWDSFVYIKLIENHHNMNKTTYYIINNAKEKIQYAMELRAINKILQNIIGEDFIY